MIAIEQQDERMIIEINTMLDEANRSTREFDYRLDDLWEKHNIIPTDTNDVERNQGVNSQIRNVPNERTNDVETAVDINPAPESEQAESINENIWPSLSYQEQTELNRYFSYFSEVYFGEDSDIQNIEAATYSTEQLIGFAIAHNIEWFEEGHFDVTADEDYFIMPAHYVASTIKEFFGIDVDHQSIDEYDFVNGRYLWDTYRYAKVHADLFSQVEQFIVIDENTFTADISIFSDRNRDWNYLQSFREKQIRYEPKDFAGFNNDEFAYYGSAEAIVRVAENGAMYLTHYQLTPNNESITTSSVSLIPQSLYEGKMDGLPLAIGDDAHLIIERMGEPLESDTWGGSYYVVYEDVTFFTDLAFTAIEMIAMRPNFSVAGVNVGQTFAEIQKVLGEGDVGFSDLYYAWELEYQIGNYTLVFRADEINEATISASLF